MIRRNIALFKIQHFFNGLWLFSALAIIYFEQVTGSYSLAMLAFSFVNIGQSLAEIPCGIFSDRISRKATLLYGAVCVFINMLLWALAGVYSSAILLFLGSLFRGIGLAFKSGTENAIIYETCQQIRQRKLFMTILAKITSFYQLGALIAAFMATFITYYFSLQTLVWLAVIPLFLNVFVVMLIVNPKNQVKSEQSPFDHLIKSIKTFTKNAKLRRYATLQILNCALLNSVFRFESVYYEKLVPIYFVNIARVLQHLMGWLSYHIAALFAHINLVKLLCYSSFGSALFRLAGLAMNNAITPFITSMQNLFYGAGQTSSTTLLQKEYNKGLRATLDSIVGLIGGIMTALIGYLLGLIADISSPRFVLFVAVVCSLFVAYAYNRLFRPAKIK